MNALTKGNIGIYSTPSAVAGWSLDSRFYAVEKMIIDSYFPKPKARVLDIGCGAGRTTLDLVNAGFDVTAIDLSDALLSVARNRLPQVEFHNMSATDILFPDSSFDAVLFSFNGIDCVYPKGDRKRVLAEALRVLVPGGTFYFSSHNFLGQFGRNFQAGYRGIMNSARFLYNQRRNDVLKEGYWVYEDGGILQHFYCPPPHLQCAELSAIGFRIKAVIGQKKYKASGYVALKRDFNLRSREHHAGMLHETRARSVGMQRLTFFYPHIHYVVSKRI